MVKSGDERLRATPLGMVTEKGSSGMVIIVQYWVGHLITCGGRLGQREKKESRVTAITGTHLKDQLYQNFIFYHNGCGSCIYSLHIGTCTKQNTWNGGVVMTH